jgi:hypothetical protein
LAIGCALHGSFKHTKRVCHRTKLLQYIVLVYQPVLVPREIIEWNECIRQLCTRITIQMFDIYIEDIVFSMIALLYAAQTKLKIHSSKFGETWLHLQLMWYLFRKLLSVQLLWQKFCSSFVFRHVFFFVHFHSKS